MVTGTSAVAQAWALLDQVADPEIPVVSIRELGILREINECDGEIEVVLTPTYSGCPAMDQIEADVRSALAGGRLRTRVTTRLAPAWTTDWITAEAHEKLRLYGIAPPHAVDRSHHVVRFSTQPRRSPPVACPRCGSADTTETSHFGSTACKALYKCLACHEPFDSFKPF
ncbi:MAG: phenylacetate-CoA oxygenase subunit PaaJ [Ramlibacter sp.]